ncbi:MAG: sulfotransferase [Myxococcota bacterium]
MSRRPDFLFVGHPRSGSGRLDDYLKRHPDLFMARKELHFFGSDLEYNHPTRTLDNYLAHFEAASPEQRVGESSTWYLASTQAAEEIYDFVPDARIVMMLREPVSWLHSLHSHMVFAAYEDITDFSEALAAEPDRAAGRRLPPHSIPKGGVLYRSLVRYRDQVRRYFDVFGRERVHVVIFDDFKADPGQVLDGVLAFLGVRTDFPGREDVVHGNPRAKNSNRVHRSRRLHRWLKRPPQRSVLHGLVEPPVPGYDRLLSGLHYINLKNAPRPPMPADLRAQLQEDFREEVAALEALLDRDLSAWRTAR